MRARGFGPAPSNFLSLAAPLFGLSSGMNEPSDEPRFGLSAELNEPADDPLFGLSSEPKKPGPDLPRGEDGFLSPVDSPPKLLLGFISSLARPLYGLLLGVNGFLSPDPSPKLRFGLSSASAGLPL